MDSQNSAAPAIHRPIVLVRGGFIGDAFKAIGDFIPNIVDLGFGLGTVVWIYYLIKIPWGLYFKARKGRIDGQESKSVGIQQDDETIQNLYTIEKRLLAVSIFGHVISALGVYGIAYLTGGKWIRPHTSLLFLGSAILRPAWESHFHIRARIEQLIKRIQYPKAYIEKLLEDVSDLQRKVTQNERNILSSQEKHLEELQQISSIHAVDITEINNRHTKDIKTITVKQQQDIRHLQEQVDTFTIKINQIEEHSKKSAEKTVFYFERLEQEFNDALTKLSADKKMIEGVRSFMQLIRENLLLAK